MREEALKKQIEVGSTGRHKSDSETHQDDRIE